MASLITVYWRDIPAQVIAERGRGRQREQAKVELSRRFAIAIDAAAMRDGADGTDDYLSAWRRAAAGPCGDDLAAEAAAKAAAIEADYPVDRIRQLVKWWPDVSLTALSHFNPRSGHQCRIQERVGRGQAILPHASGILPAVKPIRVTRQKASNIAEPAAEDDMQRILTKSRRRPLDGRSRSPPMVPKKSTVLTLASRLGRRSISPSCRGRIRWILSRWQSGYIRMA